MNRSVTQFCVAVTIYTSVAASQFSELHKLSHFVAHTYTCEQAFSRVKQNKSKYVQESPMFTYIM